MSPALFRERYTILDQYHSQRAKIRVICAGAGVTGLYLAYRMQKVMKDFELQVYEKNPECGGTWYENNYPGCACAVPSHNYTYTFRPNPRFTSYYAGSAELLTYFKDFKDEFGLDKYIEYQSKITKAVYNEDTGTWSIDITRADGTTKKDFCHVFINASGILNQWKWPDIPGREKFTGTILHSAAWDPKADWKGKKVALIGTGSSAIQITPKVQQTSEHLTIFVRSATWIAPQLGGLVSLAADPVQEGDTPVNQILLRGARPFQFTEDEKKTFEENPDLLLQLRRKMELLLCNNVDNFRVGTSVQKQTEAYIRTAMTAKLEGFGELQKKMIPDFPSGCRRYTPGEGYLESLCQENVSVVFDTITEFTEKGIKTADEQEHIFDMIICATGFDVAFAPFIDIIGRHGVNIRELWKDEPNAYLGIAAPGFPNYFVALGPRGPWGNGSIIPAMEINADYFIRMMEKMQKQNIKSFEVKQEAADDFCEHVDEWHKGSVWGQACRSWYKKTRDPLSKPLLWNDVRLEDYNWEYKNRNRFAYLGNGKIEADTYNPRERLDPITTYIRNADTPWTLE